MHLFLLRLCAGGLMLAFHGWPKWQKFDQLLTTFPDQLGWAPIGLILVIFAEAICSIFIMTGTYVRLACIPHHHHVGRGLLCMQMTPFQPSSCPSCIW